ncbi:MAG: BamA/TamA family outer membrane protein [Nitrospiria bacterium]
MIIIALLLLSFVCISPARGSETVYDLSVTYSEAAHQIEGREQITFFNNGTGPLSEIILILYPNRYRREDPSISQTHYKRAYPVVFNAGGIRVTSVKDDAGKSLSHALEPGQDTLMRVQLAEPIPPRGTGRFSVHFTTSLPEKKGRFGVHKDLVTLQGGWHPYLPARIDGKWDLARSLPNSHFRVFFKLKEGLQVISSVRPNLTGIEGDYLTYFMEGKTTPFFSLSIVEQAIRHDIHENGLEIIYYTHLKSKKGAEEIVSASQEMVSFFQEQIGAIPITRITLTDAYLFQDLTASGSQLLYINERFFKVFFLLKRFHEMRLAKELFSIFWREKLPHEEAWVAEGLAHLDAKRFILQKYGKERRLENWLKPLGFFPIIDQILYSRSLPMRKVYFPDADDPLAEEDLRLFNHPGLEGSGIFYRLKILVGNETFSRSVLRYREKLKSEPRPSFRKTLLESSQNKEVGPLIDQWLEKKPRLDFSIEEIQRKKVQDKFETRVLIKKQGEGIEPLEIILYEKDGTEIPLIWDGVGESHEVSVTTPSQIKTVTLDPHKFSSDPSRLNNRVPPSWKFLLDDFSVNYDFQTRFLSYRAGLLFQRTYDTKSWIQLFFSRSDVGTVSRIGYAITLKNGHLVSSGLTNEKRKTAPGNFQEESAGFLDLGYQINYPEIPLLEENIQRLTGTYPTLSTRLKYNQKFTGDAYDNSFFIELDLRRIFSFSNHHEVSTRIFLGESFGRLFKNNRFFLGGGTEMRGYTALAFEGENMALFSLEYRFPLLRETDLQVLGLANQRTLQIALFSDVGTVTDSRNIFRVSQYKSDIGAGLRFFLDVFGLYPTIVRFDVAIPIDSPIAAEDKPHYYLIAGQPF